MTKNILLWSFVVLIIMLMIWGGFKLFAPGYINKTKYVAKNPPFDPGKLHIGAYNFGRGVGISYAQSGQLYSPYASGDTPVVEGHYDKDVPEQDTLEGENNFFTLFMNQG